MERGLPPPLRDGVKAICRNAVFQLSVVSLYPEASESPLGHEHCYPTGARFGFGHRTHQHGCGTHVQPRAGSWGGSFYSSAASPRPRKRHPSRPARASPQTPTEISPTALTAHENRMETLFIETFPKQGALLRLLHQFGFEVEHEKPGTKELMLRKRMSPVNTEDERLNPSEFARKFGPFSVKWSQTTGFVIPIEPRFYALLFPELEPQGVLMPGSESFGNTLIKAYLCRAQTRSIRPGDLVFFYRSGDWQAIGTAGVIEQTLSSDSEVKMAEFLRKRTVYQQQDIALKCREGGALGLTFRHAPVIRRLIHLHKLVSNGVIAGPPQSITKLSSTALSWLQAHQSSHSFRSNPTTRTRSSTGERRSSFGSDRSKGLSRMS